jgi:Na+/H+-dicarboxylate symporter
MGQAPRITRTITTACRHDAHNGREHARILCGLAAGIATGLFVGEWALVLKPIADGFVKLLQMTVLPYMTVSAISGLGASAGRPSARPLRTAQPARCLAGTVARVRH